MSKLDRVLAASPAMRTTTPISGESVFGAPFMATVAYVALSIPRLVCVEVVEPLLAMFRQRSNVTVMRIIAVVDVAEKPVRTVKPGTCSKKHPANKPIRPIVAVGSTVIWSIVEIPIGADGGGSNVYADTNLGWQQGGTAQQDSCKSCESEQIHFGHDFTSSCLKLQSQR